ncbi:MAG: hypothetical protein JW943_06475 [Deltaproteobacteria bacterium]|nr:hypothetical protein [Deltaproteobacteria bacterium]
MARKYSGVLFLCFILISFSSCAKKDHSFKIDLVKYMDNSYTQNFEKNLDEVMKENGLVAGKDYKIRNRSAQGDMSALAMLIDAAKGDDVDLLITFQAPTLYTAIQRAPSVRKVFTLLQNPFLLGAGKTDADHLPNLTGMYIVPPFEELIDVISQIKPAIKKVGTLYLVGNDDSINRKDELTRIAAERKIEVIAAGYHTQDEIYMAAKALGAKQIDAFIHSQDPAQDITFPAMYQSAAAAKIPVFSVVYNMHKLGAAVICATDRDEIGRKFAQMVAKIVKGTEPNKMPFENDRDLQKKFGISTRAAAEAGLVLPEALLKNVGVLAAPALR